MVRVFIVPAINLSISFFEFQCRFESLWVQTVHLNEGPKVKHLNEGPINKQGLGTSKNKQHGICFVPKLKTYRHI